MIKIHSTAWAFAVAAALCGQAFAASGNEKPNLPPVPRDIGKSLIHVNPPPQGGDFVLVGRDGAISLQSLRDKVVLLYFGYTYCPDVCPTSMATIQSAASLLSPEAKSNSITVFVTVDPERDDISVLQKYLEFFGENIVGATGSAEEIHTVSKQYGAVYEKVFLKDSGGAYAIDHSAAIAVIDKQGRLRFFAKHDGDPLHIAYLVEMLNAEH